MLKNIFKKIEKIYVVTFLIYLMFNSIFPYIMNVNNIIKNSLAILFMSVGIIILIYKLLKERKQFFSNSSILLYIFILVCLISSFTMLKYGYIDNIKTVIWSCIIFGVLYHHYSSMNNDEIEKELKGIFSILSLIWCVAIIVGIYQFINQIGFTIKYEGVAIRKAQGFFYNRLFGIFVDPNFAAATSVILIFANIYLFSKFKRKTSKMLLTISIVLNFIYVILSGSRTGMLMLIVGVAVSSIFLFINKFADRNKKHVTLKILLSSVLCLILVVGAMAIGKKVLPAIPNLLNNKEVTENISKNATDNEPKNVTENKVVTLERNDLGNKKDASNLRFQLWGDCIEIVKSKILFGTSPRNLIPYAEESFPDTYVAKGYDCGNGFLGIVVYTGIAGTIIIAAFISVCLYKFIKYIVRVKKLNPNIIGIISVLSVMVVDAMLNQEIFFINSINTAIFWLALGLLMNNINIRKYAPLKGEDNIGIVTIHDADNYGSDLQAYATQKAIEKLGYNAYIIDHDCKKISKEYGLKRILSQKSLKEVIETIIRITILIPARKQFKKFRDKFYKLRSKNDDQSNYKKIIVGSDQVWNYKITDMDKDYFLDFVEDDKKKMAFSSSFGITEVPEDLKDEYKNLLTKFDSIAVREEQAATLIESLTGERVPVVLDPTLLLDKDDWYEVANMPYKEKGYILCYQIAHSPSLAKFAEELSLKTGKKIISIQGSLRQKFNAKYIWNAGPAEYVGLIKNADYVVTNSFHGTAFSINLNKNFFTEMLPSREKTSSRLENILDKFNLRSRQIVDGKNDNMLNDINFEEVNNIIEEEREKSIKLLKDNIEKV